jgi:hypothetical protein
MLRALAERQRAERRGRVAETLATLWLLAKGVRRVHIGEALSLRRVWAQSGAVFTAKGAQMAKVS